MYISVYYKKLNDELISSNHIIGFIKIYTKTTRCFYKKKK